MKTFDLRDPRAWTPVIIGEVLSFDAYSKNRQIAGTVNATKPVEMWLSFDGSMSNAILIGAGETNFNFAFTTSIDAHIWFIGDETTEIFMRSPALSHYVVATDEPVHTTVVPRQRRNSDLDRMMYLMRLNENRRDAVLDKAIREVKATGTLGGKQSLELSDEAIQKAEDEAKLAKAKADAEAETKDDEKVVE